jgi:tRNA splicing endonuclease
MRGSKRWVRQATLHQPAIKNEKKNKKKLLEAHLRANEPVKRLQLHLLRAVYVFDRGADLMGAEKCGGCEQ